MPINVKPEGGVGVGTLTFSENISLSKHHSPEQPGWSKVAKQVSKSSNNILTILELNIGRCIRVPLVVCCPIK